MWQKVLLWIFYCEIVLQAQGLAIKRSPLEVGYATFPSEVDRHKNVHVARKADKHTVVIPGSSSVGNIHHTHVWVPGQIRHHSFIPAHIHHIYVPVLLARDLEVPSVLEKPEDDYFFYPKHYGGFGIGTYSGGQGAGPGYQIVFND